MAQDTAHTTQGIERAHRQTGAKRTRSLHTQNNAPSRHTGELEASGPGHRARDTTDGMNTPVNRSQVAQDTAHRRQCTKLAHR